MLFKIMLDEELQAMVGILNDNMNTICQEWVHLSARKLFFSVLGNLRAGQKIN